MLRSGGSEVLQRTVINVGERLAEDDDGEEDLSWLTPRLLTHGYPKSCPAICSNACLPLCLSSLKPIQSKIKVRRPSSRSICSLS